MPILKGRSQTLSQTKSVKGEKGIVTRFEHLHGMQIALLNLESMLSRSQIITPAILGQKALIIRWTPWTSAVSPTLRGSEVARFEAEGRKVHVVAAHSGGCCLNVNRIKDVQAAIKRERAAGADVVIFSFHGGAEGSKARHVPGKLELAWGEKRGNVKALARAAVDAGADVVIGHGPHVLRAMELYKGKLIAYSLGNFCGYRAFSVRSIYSRTSAILDIVIDEVGNFVRGKLVPLRLDQQARPRLDPEKHAFSQVSELGQKDFPDTYVSVGTDGTLQVQSTY